MLAMNILDLRRNGGKPTDTAMEAFIINAVFYLNVLNISIESLIYKNASITSFVKVMRNTVSTIF